MIGIEGGRGDAGSRRRFVSREEREEEEEEEEGRGGVSAGVGGYVIGR